MPSPIPTITPSTALTTLAGQAVNTTFIGRVAIAVGLVAAAVVTEDPAYYNVTPSAGSGAGQHYARLRLAMLVTTNLLAYATQSFAYYVLADGVTTSASTDAQILARVAALWNDLSTPYL